MKLPRVMAGVGAIALAFALTFEATAGESTFPPAPPLPTSPVAVFRQLLAMEPAERFEALSRRPERQRESLRLRLVEYDALPSGIREQRLRATDLYWHIRQLLPRAASERTDLLSAAPTELRGVLTERLALWDRLPAADRQALLQHERAIGYFAQLRQIVPPPLPGTNVTVEASPAVPLRLQAELAHLQGLPPADRQRLVDAWRRFFDTPVVANNASVQAMTEPERMEMEAVLQRFRALPATQRNVCIESFARFATMKPEERAGFLRNAARWESLSPEERATWRRLVTKLPPLPPVPETFTPPPFPPTIHRSRLLTGATPALMPAAP